MPDGMSGKNADNGDNGGNRIGRGRGWFVKLPVRDRDRMKMYEKIAKVHKDIVEAKWRARTTNTPFGLKPDILLHLEESVAFLAEEVLKLQSAFEDQLSSAIKEGLGEALGMTAEVLENTKGSSEDKALAAVRMLEEKAQTLT